MDEGLWTIEELAEHVADALTSAHPAQPSGRVREVPDRRTIRWYTTIGLVDRPAAMRGRTALYGRRHLLQLVAVKRLQAEGRSLASVQEELLGAADAVLERIADLPAVLSAEPRAGVPAGAPPVPAAVRARFWSAPPAAPMPSAPAPPAPAKALAGPVAPAAASPAAPATPIGSAADPAALTTAAASRNAQPSLVPAIRLGDGATLLLDTTDRAPTADELAAIDAAAAPLLDLLRRLDLTKGSS